jgi:hypothetical protein
MKWGEVGNFGEVIVCGDDRDVYLNEVKVLNAFI